MAGVVFYLYQGDTDLFEICFDKIEQELKYLNTRLQAASK